MNTLNIIKKQIQKLLHNTTHRSTSPVIAVMIAPFTKAVKLCTVPSAIAVVPT